MKSLSFHLRMPMINTNWITALVTSVTSVPTFVQIALAAYSEYLIEKFTEFPSNQVISIDLSQYPPVAVLAVLRFVYTGEVEMNLDTVGCIWKVAEDLGICTVVGLCEDYLGQPTVDSAIFHFAIAERFGLTNLGSRIYEFITERQVVPVVASEGIGRRVAKWGHVRMYPVRVLDRGYM